MLTLKQQKWFVRLIVISGYVTVVPAMAQASGDALSRALDISAETNEAEAKSQQRIDTLSDQSRAMLEEYRQLSRELDALSVYNNQLERLVASQDEEARSIETQMAGIDVTRRDIVPLTLQMVAWLTAFVEHDMPFLPEERQMRVTQLSELMDRADISIGEKFRQVLDAYQIELQYSRTIEAYRGQLNRDGQLRTVDFLRVGRVGLYYLTLDRRECGHWDAVEQTWRPLPSRYALAIRDGLRIADKQAAPALLQLPVAAPHEISP